MRGSAFALFLALPLAACSQAAPTVKDAYMRDSVGGTSAAAVYMTITSPTDDKLIGASAPVAKKTDLMTMTMAGGAMGMDYVKVIDLPAGKPVSLNPKGLHVWLADLNKPLKAGQTIQVTLKFEKAGEQRVAVSIIDPAAPAPGGK